MKVRTYVLRKGCTFGVEEIELFSEESFDFERCPLLRDVEKCFEATLVGAAAGCG
jgi:hypothetical protein